MRRCHGPANVREEGRPDHDQVQPGLDALSARAGLLEGSSHARALQGRTPSRPPQHLEADRRTDGQLAHAVSGQS
ncbi:hypothetical protein VARIO8X_110053 [Burkholderiales bacterium 8X]|nr:hypothetical protein VARIO8X_110053 [Burkholderiales bacterium 8X]